MELSVGKFKLNLQVLLLILILVVVTSFGVFSSCARVSANEAFTDLLSLTNVDNHLPVDSDNKILMGPSTVPGRYAGETYSTFPEKPLNLDSWRVPNIGVVGSEDNMKLKNYKTPKIPGKGGRLSYLSDADFKPECCDLGSPYSNSMGCACLSYDASKFLITRGGNAVPFIQGSSF